ncbi:MAG: hypothetical protein H3C43_12250 [Leptonema sp. (in: Bacteria)]|nr:hypothetical protein [Leptonema sp. (in: bacteria)]
MLVCVIKQAIQTMAKENPNQPEQDTNQTEAFVNPAVNEADVPIVGRRRIALLNGACGTSDRVRVEGEILDVPVLQSHLNEPWSHTAMLPKSLMRRFRAVQDAGITPVRSPKLKIEVLAADSVNPETDEPLFVWNNVSPKGATRFSIEVKDHDFIPPGQYLLRFSLLGVDSIRQHVTDLAYLGTGSSQYSQKNTMVGFGRLRVLADDFTGILITSDIDQTFLNTKIESRQGLVDTLFERIESKEPLPGMDTFYRQLRTHNLPLFFISASPNFFRRTLESVFEQFQISHDGLFLKNLLGPLNNIARKGLEILANLEEYVGQNINQAMERSAKFLGSTMQSMVDQIAYKLTVLLEQRTMMPTQSQEILIGDNTESDYFIFTVYQYLLLGNINGDEVEDYFYHLNFHNREAVTRDSAKRIRALVETNIQIHGKTNPVKAVWIHRALPEMNQTKMIASLMPAMPKLESLLEAGLILPPVDYKNAFELSLLSLNQKLIEPESVVKVAAACKDKILRDERLDIEVLNQTIDNFKFKKEVYKEQIKKAIALN